MGSTGTHNPARLITGGLLALVLLVLAIGGIKLATYSEPIQPPSQAAFTAEVGAPPGAPQSVAAEDARYVRARQQMIENDLRGRDIRDERVLDVMGRIRRQEFVPEANAKAAYADRPLPIGFDQTISQPYIVALMTQLVGVKPEGRALDIGTGSGYQAAILAELYKEVYSIEIVESLAKEARKRLDELGYKNVTVRAGDGYRGWPEHAPFDAIVVAAAPDHIPQALIDQLAPGGRLVIPVGRYFQQLVLIEKRADGTIRSQNAGGVAFVPMTGEAATGEAAKGATD